MLYFCPACGNLLTVAPAPPDVAGSAFDDSGAQNRMTCRTCPYVRVLRKSYVDKRELPRKEVADILGGGDEFQNCSTTEASCPNEKCDGSEAKFYQLQIRSADEPMTSFMKCVRCGRRWME
ncbi:uncharacterized protein PV09_02850 [Verruconis gallopava]|uniref:DNA-directed RNA polymerase subunit n=1 Tax=Verruconis gallopava TaxID=253628 RepID=A0A0D1Z0A6_9PEZI|nr:uncharacterized protein PV09_02850 [Verruconis gallopava]KIW06397.1 hypothetical protein PV09_02850 [Verruconis gallopava]